MPSRTYNPEKRAWRGKSHKKGRAYVADLRDKAKSKDSDLIDEIVADRTKRNPSFPAMVRAAVKDRKKSK